MEPDFEAILRTFAVEADDNLRPLDEGLVVLEQQPDDAETLATIFRMAHTLKGNAASLGFQTLTDFAHGFEEILDVLRRRTLVVDARLITLLLESVDALRSLVASALAGESEMSAAHRGLLERLVSAASARSRRRPRRPSAIRSGRSPASAPYFRAARRCGWTSSGWTACSIS